MALYSLLFKPTRDKFLHTITEEKQRIVGEHFMYLKALMEEKKLLFAGRTASASFGIAVFNVLDERTLLQIVKKDPCVINGIFSYETDSFSFALLDAEAMKSYATT